MYSLGSPAVAISAVIELEFSSPVILYIELSVQGETYWKSEGDGGFTENCEETKRRIVERFEVVFKAFPWM